jgi:hypothetical protein
MSMVCNFLFLGCGFRVIRHLLAVVVAADVAEDVSGDAKPDPDPIPAIQGKDNHVHQCGPWSEDQAQEAHQPGEVKHCKCSVDPDWRDQLVNQETQSRAKKHERSEETTHSNLLLKTLIEWITSQGWHQSVDWHPSGCIYPVAGG